MHEPEGLEKPGNVRNACPKLLLIGLAQVTRSLCGLKPSTLRMQHKVESSKPRLVVLITKHVDDLKLIGIKEEIVAVLQYKEHGTLKLAWHNFTDCGARRRQDVKTQEIVLDPHEYIVSLRIIAHAELAGKRAEEPICFWTT